MPRIRAIAEAAPTSNPRRVSKVNPRHPASKLYTSPDGGSVRLTWSPVNSTWFLLWPGDAPVERQQVLGQFPHWEEGDREARRITAGGPNPADAPEERERRRTMGRENPHGDPPGTSLRGFHVILRGGRPSVRVMASSKYDAEQQVRAWGQPDLYPIWYILSDEEVAQQNIGQNVVDNPRRAPAKIVGAWIRHYSDNGQSKAGVRWQNHDGTESTTEGDSNNAHMQALLERAKRDGVRIQREER